MIIKKYNFKTLIKKYKEYKMLTTQSREPFFKLTKKYLNSSSVVLDVGAGDTSFADYLSLNPENTFLIDGNKESIEKMKLKYPKSQHYKFQDKLPFSNASFDLVHCSHFIEHLYPNEVYNLLKEFDRVLKPNGFLVVSAPLMHDKFYDDLSHIKPYTPEIFIKYLGFKNVKNLTRKKISNLYDVKEIKYRRGKYIIPPIGHSNKIINFFFYFIFICIRLTSFKINKKNGYTIILQKLLNNTNRGETGKNGKFKFIDSSETPYGIAKQLEKQLINKGYTNNENGISICYADDIGLTTSNTGKRMTPKNCPSLYKAINSKADLIFNSQKICEKWFKNVTNAFYLPSAVDKNIFYDLNLKRDVPIGFVGKMNGHIRKNFIEKSKKKFKKKLHVKELFFHEMAQFYNQCKIVINDSTFNEINMRMFEATACGALLITKRIPVITDFWKENEEIILYETMNEMEEKVNYYLQHEKERKIIAKKGQEKTLKYHTYQQRSNKIIRLFHKI